MRNSKKILSFLVAIVMVIASIQIAPVTAQGATAVKVTNVVNNKKIMYRGSSFVLKTNSKNVTYQSNKPKIVSVTSDGILYAKKVGKATITVKNNSGKKKLFTINKTTTISMYVVKKSTKISRKK